MGEAKDTERKWETDEETEDSWKEVDVIQQMNGRKHEVRVGVLKKWGFWKSRIIKSKWRRWYEDNGKTDGRWKKEDVGEGLGENVYTKWRGRLQPSVHKCLTWTSNTYRSLVNEIGHNSEIPTWWISWGKAGKHHCIDADFHYCPKPVIKYLTCHYFHL